MRAAVGDRSVCLRPALGLVAALALAACHGSGGESKPATATATATATAIASAVPSPTPATSETPVAEDERSAPPTADPNEFLAEADRNAIQGTISAQLAALRHDDAHTAFSLAAPVIQEMFQTPEIFFQMVRTAYAPLYRPRYTRFGELTTVAGEITQKLIVVDEEGRPVTALFLMDRQPNGAWRIMGCLLVPSEEAPV